MMEPAEDGNELIPKADIGDVPEEVLEMIFGHLSPYADLKSSMLVCRQWHRVVSDLIVKLQRNFHQMLRASEMTWSFIASEQPPTITDRFSHSACYFHQSMYIFGGCSATNTTFNDLWRFDLTTRQWARPVASGTYPSPKACASMVVYKDSLVLYGGWSRPTPMPLHQAPRYFSELHMYTPSTNRWSQIMAMSHDTHHPVAGHSASIMGDAMVVFGGSHDTGSGCNDVWLFDFVESSWKKPVITGKKPNPRYGQSQKTLDEEHVMIVGGCGGANQMFSDVWLLHLRDNEGTWEEVMVHCAEFSPPALWCHPACMVNGMAVFISKNSKVKGSTPEPSHHNRIWIPPQLNQAQPAGPLPNGAAPHPPPHHPHIPPPPPFPPMAAFQRRREDGGGGGGFGAMGAAPPAPGRPPDIVQQPNFHGAENPNIRDVQRLNLRGGLRGAVAGGLHGHHHPHPHLPPHSLPSPGVGAHHDASCIRFGASALNHGAGGASDDERPGPSNAGLGNILGPSNNNAGSSGNNPESPEGARAALLPGAGFPSHHRPHNFPLTDSDSDSDLNPDVEMAGAQAPRPGYPSVRPNAMHNRQRQLDMLRKHEDRLRSRNSNNSQNRSGASNSNVRGADYVPRNPMVLHVLDFSEVVASGTATWLPTRETITPGAPEETIFYSLVEGRGELVLFGGIQHDQNPMQRVNSPPNSGSHVVSNGLFVISPKWLRRL
ncbi:F-box only protein 42-like [Littorina saxatilis]